MKNVLIAIAGSVFITLLSSSCATNKFGCVYKSNVLHASKVSKSTSFVKLKNGKTVFYNKLEIVKGVFTAPHLLANESIKIKPSEIEAYQIEDHYAVSQKYIMNGHKSAVAVDALPGFAKRLVKGKLNVYSKKYFNGRFAIDEFFLQSENDSRIYAYTPELFKQMIEDNKDALNYYHKEIVGVVLSKKITNTAEMYNQSTFMTKN
jgi:hypothetical protein